MKNFQTLREILIRIQEAYRVPNRLDQKYKSPWDVLIEMPRVENK